MTWDVGRGDSALFLEDSWDGLPPLGQNSSFENLKTKLINYWGNKVSDYKSKHKVGNKVEWKWKSIKDIEDDPTIIKEYKKLVLSRNIKQVDREDKLIWVVSNDGKYNVKTGYNTLINSEK